MLLAVSIFVLSACQQNEDSNVADDEKMGKEVTKEDVRDFLIEYKSITHDLGSPAEKDVSEVLEAVKPYLNDEWYEMNERDKRVNFPRNYANASGNDVKLNDVVIDNLEENANDEGYEVKYTLLLTVGKEDVEKEGDMKILQGDPKGFVITYDWEKQITVDGYQFR